MRNTESPSFVKGQKTSTQGRDEFSDPKSRTSKLQLQNILKYNNGTNSIVEENCTLVKKMCDDRKKLMEQDKNSMDKELGLIDDKQEEFDILDLLICLTGIGLIYEIYKVGCAVSNEIQKLSLKGERQALSQEQINVERYSRHAMEQAAGNYLPLEHLFCQKLTEGNIETYAKDNHNQLTEYMTKTHPLMGEAAIKKVYDDTPQAQNTELNLGVLAKEIFTTLAKQDCDMKDKERGALTPAMGEAIKCVPPKVATPAAPAAQQNTRNG
ncbi:MAG: hypothetical protein ACI9CD_000695 [Candidatus Deianiraeaceae bacterium]|jgi:hypothetical protein